MRKKPIICLIDDESTPYKLLETLVEKKAEIIHARSYEEAQSMLDTCYDLYVIDLYLNNGLKNGFDGLKLFHQLKIKHPNSKVIIWSSLGTKEIEEECKGVGADLFWSKTNYSIDWKEQINAILLPPQILVIDDEVDRIKSIFQFLFYDYHLHFATSLHEGVEIIQKEKISLIILDLELDKSSRQRYTQGIVNVKNLKQYNIPIIIISGNNTDVTVIPKLYKLGITDYLSKNEPNPIQWKSTIQKAINHPINKNGMYNNKRIEAINESLERCVHKYTLHLKDFEAESEARAFDGKQGMKKFNQKISDLEFELLSFTSDISENEKEVLIEQIKESRNPDNSAKDRFSAKKKAIELLKKYGSRIIEIGGQVALVYILQSLGLTLAELGLSN